MLPLLRSQLIFLGCKKCYRIWLQAKQLECFFLKTLAFLRITTQTDQLNQSNEGYWLHKICLWPILILSHFRSQLLILSLLPYCNVKVFYICLLFSFSIFAAFLSKYYCCKLFKQFFLLRR